MSFPSSANPNHLGLSGLGWSPYWVAHAGAADRPGARPGRVVRADRAHCLVHTGETVIHAGLAEHVTPPPTTGDWVLLDDTRPDDVRIVAALPRRTAFTRGAGRNDARGQVLAANLDVVAVVHALSAAPNLGRIERLTALAWASGAQPVVVLSKADLSGDPDGDVAEVAAACPGAEVVAVSTVDGAGLEALRGLLPSGSTGAFIGPSGVGKSSLVNALAGAEILATAEIRDDGKGRHTSVTRELVPLPWGAVVIDTPGLRGVQLWDAAEGVEATFADIVELADECKFHDCRHHTEPGCAVQAAIAGGTLSPRRLESYEKLQREQAWLAGRYDARLRAEQRAKWKALVKANRNRPSR